MLWRSDFALESAACCLYVAYCGIAMAARMPMIATTTSSSINVKPCSFLLFISSSLLPFLADRFWSLPFGFRIHPSLQSQDHHLALWIQRLGVRELASNFSKLFGRVPMSTA